MTEQFINILDDCIEAVLAGRENFDSCCARYPHLKGDLKPLLEIALLSREALEVEVPATAREASRDKVMAAAHRPALVAGVARRSQGFVRGFLLRPLVLGAGLIFLIFAGTALAASGSEPDSFLYPLEQRLESTRTVLTPGTLDKARVEIGHANERLDEMENVTGKGKPEYLPELLAKFNNHMDNATRLVNKASDKGEDTGEVEGMMKSTRERFDKVLADINDSIPDEMRDSVRDALNESDHDAYGPASGSYGGDGANDDPASSPGGSDRSGEDTDGDSAGSTDSPDSESSNESRDETHNDEPQQDEPRHDKPQQDESHDNEPSNEDPENSHMPDLDDLQSSVTRTMNTVAVTRAASRR